jgi:hypothetical protein
VDCRDGLAQQQVLAAAGDDGQRIEAARLGGRGQQVELEHTAVGYTVVASGVDALDDGAEVIGAGQGRQK